MPSDDPLTDDEGGDEWAAPGAGGDSPRRMVAVGRPMSSVQVEAMRRVAREEITRSWSEVGVNFGSADGRLAHLLLLQWMRERKAQRDAGVNKAFTVTIGAVASAVVAAAIAFMTGRHP